MGPPHPPTQRWLRRWQRNCAQPAAKHVPGVLRSRRVQLEPGTPSTIPAVNDVHHNLMDPLITISTTTSACTAGTNLTLTATRSVRSKTCTRTHLLTGARALTSAPKSCRPRATQRPTLTTLAYGCGTDHLCILAKFRRIVPNLNLPIILPLYSRSERPQRSCPFLQ